MLRRTWMVAFLAMASCITNVSPEDVNRLSDGGLSTTEYAGLSIYGSLVVEGWFPMENGPDYAAGYTGKLDLVELTSVVHDWCMDSIISSQDGKVGDIICFSQNKIDDDDVYIYADQRVENLPCKARICGQSLNLCAAYKFLELAEAIAPVALEGNLLKSEVFDHGNQGFIASKLVWDDSVDVKNYAKLKNCFDKTQECLFQYTIPPQKPENKTLLLYVAFQAFREAGVYGSATLHEPTCRAMVTDDSLPPTEGQPLWEVFGVEYNDVQNRLSETLDAMITHQMGVADSALSKYTDHQEAQEMRWAGSINSRTAIYRLLAGFNSKAVCEPCTVQLKTAGVKKALGFLRAGRPKSIFSTATPVEVAQQAHAYIKQDLGSSGGGVQLDDYMQKQGFNFADVALAKKHLMEESVALARMPKESKDEYRLANLSSRAMVQPATYWQTKIMGMEILIDSVSALDKSNIARKSALDYLSYARDGAVKVLLDSSISDSVKRLYAPAAQSLHLQAGDRKVVVNVDKDDKRIDLSIKGHFPGEGWEDGYFTSTQTMVVVKSEEGYRCLMEGSIDGKECDTKDYTILESNNVVPVDPPNYQREDPFGQQIGITVFEPEGLDPEMKYFVFQRNADGTMVLLGGFTPLVPDGETERVFYWPANGETVKGLEAIQGRSNKSCARPKLCCMGVLCDIVPPLETELTSDSDPNQYESSWRHYLQLAKEAAAEADRLGDELIREGLEMDLRAEEAAMKTEELCGGSVNVGDIFKDPAGNGGSAVAIPENVDPTLEQCLPGKEGTARLPLVSLGPPLCVFRKDDQSPWCTCPDDFQGVCPSCPIIAGNDDAGDPVQKCRVKFPGIPQEWIVDVTKALNIFQSQGSPDTTSQTPKINCKHVHDMRIAFEAWAYNEGKLSDDTTDATDLSEMYPGLSEQHWFNRPYFVELQKQVKLNPDPFFHYKLMLNNSVFWSTHRAHNGGSCPSKEPFRAYVDATSNAPIHCDHCDTWNTDNPGMGYFPGKVYLCNLNESQAEWVNREWSCNMDSVYPNEVCSGNTNLQSSVAERIEWGVRFANIMKTISILSGMLTSFYVPARYNKNKWYAPTEDLQPIGMPYRNLPLASEDPDGRVCAEMPLDLYQIPNPLPEFIDDNLKTVLLDMRNGDPHTILLANWDLSSSLNECHWHDGMHHDAYVDPFNKGNRERNDVMIQDANAFWSENQSNNKKSMLTDYNQYKEAQVGQCHYNNWRGENNLACCMSPYGSYKTDVSAYNTDELVPDLCMSANRLYETLEFGCFMANRLNGSCLDISQIPDVQSKDDLYLLSRQIECAADTINQRMQILMLPNFPEALWLGFQNSGVESYYTSTGGKRLETLIALEDSLRNIAAGAERIKEIVYDVGKQIQITYTKIQTIEFEAQISHLQTIVNQIKIAIEAFQFHEASSGKKPWQIAIRTVFGAAAFAALHALEYQISELQQQVANNEAKVQVYELSLAVAGKFGELNTVMQNIEQAWGNLQANLAALDSIEKQALIYASRTAFADYDETGHIYPVNTAMRRRYNTTRIRYRKALERAKKLAYIARRAIEFRLGIDMGSMTKPLALVDPPKNWVEDICNMEGLDYSRIRQMAPDPDSEDSTDYAKYWDGRVDDYSHQYIGDYVQKLSDLVESYPFNYSFQDGEDIAVISLKDDIKPTAGPCMGTSYNHLYYSDDIGGGDESASLGWKYNAESCNSGVDDSCLEILSNDASALASFDEGFCYDRDPMGIDEAECNNLPSRAERIMDRRRFQIAEQTEDGTQLVWTRPEGGYNSGYMSQITDVLDQGSYMLSFWHKCPVAPSECVNFRVEVWGVGESSSLLTAPRVKGPGSGWTREIITFSNSATRAVEIRIHPSDADDSVNGITGDVWMWGMQLEKIDPNRCPIISNCEPLEYLAVEDSMYTRIPNCPDSDGSGLRKHFKPKCICSSGKNGECEDGVFDPTKRCYWEVGFILNLDDVEKGELIPSAAISIGNFNYRHIKTSLNLVGTNVRYCPPNSPTTCYSNAYIPYTLEHSGEVEVTDYESNPLTFIMSTARIEHGKALAAEVLITNPLSSNHATLIAPYEKLEFRGRPIQGQYTLKIWDVPELVWDNVKDIQLVWKYRYWTKFDSTN